MEARSWVGSDWMKEGRLSGLGEGCLIREGWEWTESWAIDALKLKMERG